MRRILTCFIAFAAIDVSSGKPCVFWDPVLSGRTYTIYGCDYLSPAATWYAVPTNELAPQPVAYPAPVVYPHRYHRPYHYRRW